MIKSKKFWVTVLVVLVGQAALYWFIKLFQSNYHYIEFFLDDKIPLIPRTIWIYNSFYPVLFISYYCIFKKSEKNFMNAMISCILCTLISDIFFICYPTIIDHGVVPATDKLTKLALDITYFFDNPATNCFPSIHCSYSFQCMFALYLTKDLNKKFRWPMIIYLFFVAISTVFTKQHYFYDIIGGLVVFIIANIVTYKLCLYDKLKKIKFNA